MHEWQERRSWARENVPIKNVHISVWSLVISFLDPEPPTPPVDQECRHSQPASLIDLLSRSPGGNVDPRVHIAELALSGLSISSASVTVGT
jgi:hypothetical protein